MGCSYDMLGATIRRKEDIKTFVEIFNEELKYDIDGIDPDGDGFLNENDFESDGNSYSTFIAAEPLFNEMENGAQFKRVVLEYLKAVPDVPFSAWYRCTYDNCGAIDTSNYNYSDGVLKIESRHSKDSELDWCRTCDWNAYEDDVYTDVVCTAEEYEPDKEYSCPKCGASLKFDVRIFYKTLKLIDGNWIKEDDK